MPQHAEIDGAWSTALLCGGHAPWPTATRWRVGVGSAAGARACVRAWDGEDEVLDDVARLGAEVCARILPWAAA